MASLGLKIWTDGASSGNPGPASVGILIHKFDQQHKGTVVCEISETIRDCTSNEAEYEAVLRALMEAKNLSATHVQIFCDSQLIVRQISGDYACNHERLGRLRDAVRAEAKAFHVFTIQWIPRDQNTAADALAEKALGVKVPESAFTFFNFQRILKERDDLKREVVDLRAKTRRCVCSHGYSAPQNTPGETEAASCAAQEAA